MLRFFIFAYFFNCGIRLSNCSGFSDRAPSHSARGVIVDFNQKTVRTNGKRRFAQRICFYVLTQSSPAPPMVT